MASSSSRANSEKTTSSAFFSAADRSLSPHISPMKVSSFEDPPLFSSTNVFLGNSAEQVLGSRAHTYNGSVSSSNERWQEENNSEVERLNVCDVFVGFYSRGGSLLKRFVKWLRAEMVMHGLSCFVTNRARCLDATAHAMARMAMEEATLGLVIITRKSFSNPWSIEELKILLGRKNLIPVFFGLSQSNCLPEDIVERNGEFWKEEGGALWKRYGGLEGEWRETLEGLSRLDYKLEVHMSNMRDCILEAIGLIGVKLGRRDVVERVRRWKDSTAKDELPFMRNPSFTGREKELVELKLILFGDGELEGDNDFINLPDGESCKCRSGSDKKKNKGNAKEQLVWRESKEEIEMEYVNNVKDNNKLLTYNHVTLNGRKKKPRNYITLGKGIANVSGVSGIGKTDLLLEFSYRNLQSYKLVLWVNGETRYIRANYLNLLPRLGVDVNIDDELCLKRKDHRSFEETEGEVIQKVRKELMRGIPYLLVIDNLENEKDQWDGRNIMELLPHFGGDTHIIISSRLPRIVNVQPLRLSYLSSHDALALMNGRLSDLEDIELDALKIIEERLGRLPFGLALVGALISEHSLDPPKLLDAINRMPYIETRWTGKEDAVLRRYPFLIQLLDVCFSVFDQKKKHGRMAMIMMQVSSLFAPAPIPISMISFATHEAYKERYSSTFWIKCCQMFTCGLQTQKANPLRTEDVGNMLVRFHLARCSTSEGSISFHEISRIYAHKRGGDRFASAMVTAVSIFGFLPMHSNHIWEASFLLFKLNASSTAVNLSVPDLLSFIKKFVIPLANYSFTSLSQCAPVLDLLRVSTEALESIENLNLAKTIDKEVSSFCFMGASRKSILHANPQLYLDVVHLRATLLEIRARFFLKCGQYDIGEQLCRTALNIKEVIYGWEHPETLSTQEIMARLIRLQSNV